MILLRVFLFMLCAGLSGRAAEAQIRTNGRDELTCAVVNSGHVPLSLHWPAGALYTAPGGEKWVALKAADLTIAPGQSGEAAIPAAALSSIGAPLAGPVSASAAGEEDPRLAALWPFLAGQPDLPRATSQCVVLALTEDVTFAQWTAFRASPQTPDEPLLEAVDALGILRFIAKDRAFRLATDPQLKFRALRQPATRGKAALIYGLTVPGDAAPGQIPPDVGQLLHTKPGDNCPICRMRAQMQAPASEL